MISIERNRHKTSQLLINPQWTNPTTLHCCSTQNGLTLLLSTTDQPTVDSPNHCPVLINSQWTNPTTAHCWSTHNWLTLPLPIAELTMDSPYHCPVLINPQWTNPTTAYSWSTHNGLTLPLSTIQQTAMDSPWRLPLLSGVVAPHMSPAA